ncbi:uncharacterized protein LOC125816604 [Solanum verrucosum]|uniref:uncharacterized protein LOC125816604 n=1 Tax=Solanum verrucosum TaxID=315347 RepID=UPI0020D17E9C|nr:uncharacterized protein LOC125816604 [Solanum verrucosum]
MSPEIELLLKSRYSRFSKPSQSDDIPVKRFLAEYTSVRFLDSLKDGNEPVKLFKLKSRRTSWVRFSIEDGIGPVKLQALSSTRDNFLRFPMDSGTQTQDS